ncbi:helix-turn-helix domain-containing protein [Streptomyces sp. NPDC091287]|uniref:helix-turn-helix domain-containing protein n=1 Tax=Streptomyces sp. NPDC091287 TaxID=3365988 RepID=UPI0037F520E8
MAELVGARRLTDEEGQRLQRIVRRGRHESVRVRRALIIMASASGTPVTAIARLVTAHEDTVRDVINAFNERGLAALDPRWARARPRLISDDEREFIITTAKTRPVGLGQPFTHWSLRKLFGPLRNFIMGGSNHPNHPALARKLQDYLRWRNANARHPDVLAAQRRERAKVRSERQQRWGRPRPQAA